MRKSNVWTSVMLVVFLSVFVFGCNKYDKISILGEWEIDIKEARNLGASVDSAKEVLFFLSSPVDSYKQTYKSREGGKFVTWEIKGKIERKNNKITFTNRIKDEDENNKQGDVTHKYRVEGDKLTLIVEGEGYPDNEKVYTKVAKTVKPD